MNTVIDIESIYREERLRWFKEEAPRRGLRELITASVPYWIILVAFVLYGLSAPHTAGIFDKLTPGYGFMAPIGVEFGLLYAAFRRRWAKSEKQQLHWTLWALEILLFITAMLVNGAGSLTSVVDATGLRQLPFAAIKDQFEQLPATSQAALIMAGLSAFIIPIGALVAGDGLAALTMELRTKSDYREQMWQEVEFNTIYRAVYFRYLQQGVPEREARQKATSEVRGYLKQSSSSAVRLLSAQAGQAPNEQVDTLKNRVRAYLNEHPYLTTLSINQVVESLKADGIEAGRTTIAEVLQEKRRVAGLNSGN